MREKAQNYSFWIALKLCDHSLRKGVISANYHKAVQGCAHWHVWYVIDRLYIWGSCAVFLQVDLSMDQPKTSSQHPKSPEHISWVLRWAFSVPWWDLSSYTFSLIVWKRGNAAQEWDASPSTLRCNLDRLYETGENSQIGAGQLGKENGPTWPAEGHLPDSHLVKCQSPSPAELSAIQQSHAEFTLSYGHTPLPHSSEAIHNDLVFRRLFVVLQE